MSDQSFDKVERLLKATRAMREAVEDTFASGRPAAHLESAIGEMEAAVIVFTSYALSATRCTACGAKVGEPCRGNCERAMPSSIGDTTASSTMYVNGHFDIREALDKPTRKADLDLARYILKNLCGWNCRDVVSDEERDTEYLADMISAARYGHATQSATVEIDQRMLMLIRVLDDLEESGNGWNPATMPRSANEAERKFRDMLATNWKDIRRLIPIRASDGGVK
jgi:hypothetical protein